MPYHFLLWYQDEMKSQNPEMFHPQSGLLYVVLLLVFTVFFLAQTEQESLNINTDPPCIEAAEGVM